MVIGFFVETFRRNVSTKSQVREYFLSVKNKLHLEKEITALEARLADLNSRLPAHSIPPAMMAELDDIEEQLNQAKSSLADLSA